MAARINWIAVRTAYVVQGWSAQKCAEEFKVDPTTVKKRASAEGWTKERHRIATDATTIATEQITNAALIAVNEIREEHAGLVKRMHTIVDGIDADLAAMKPGRSRIEARKAAADAFSAVLKSSRLVLGITDGQNSMADAHDTGERKIIFEEVADEQAETA